VVKTELESPENYHGRKSHQAVEEECLGHHEGVEGPKTEDVALVEHIFGAVGGPGQANAAQAMAQERFRVCAV
jgi:hypothetical protein